MAQSAWIGVEAHERARRRAVGECGRAEASDHQAHRLGHVPGDRIEASCGHWSAKSGLYFPTTFWVLVKHNVQQGKSLATSSTY